MIPCVFDCVHQKDGVCRLDCARGVYCCDSGLCAHYIKKSPRGIDGARTRYSVDACLISTADGSDSDNLD